MDGCASFNRFVALSHIFTRVAELEAIFGWQGGTMAALYTRSADRRRLALTGMQKLDLNERELLFPHLYIR
jgi:hypothetical protein